MATSRISQLTPIPTLNPNTANVAIVATDKQTGVSGRISATALANGLYANNVLNVGNNAVVLPNTIAQFAGTGDAYVQVNMLNNNNGGTADYVATANTGNDTTYFIDVGYSNKDFAPGSEYNSLGNSISPLDGYIYVQGKQGDVGGNLAIGTTSTGTELRFIVGGGTAENVAAKLSATAVTINRTIHFGDGTTQNTSFAAAASYANSAYLQANTPSHVANSAAIYANVAFVQANAAFLTANTPSNVANSASIYANGAFIQANSAYNKANAALANTASITTSGDLVVSGALYAANTIRTPNIFPGSQTAITLSFTNSSLEKVNTATGLTITLTNFVTGKFIDLFITNTDNSQHTITHGCSATNSSVGATSFNLAATRTAYLRYASLDGNLANTFVAIVYA